jgi:hypothetical protein
MIFENRPPAFTTTLLIFFVKAFCLKLPRKSALNNSLFLKKNLLEKKTFKGFLEA